MIFPSPPNSKLITFKSTNLNRKDEYIISECKNTRKKNLLKSDKGIRLVIFSNFGVNNKYTDPYRMMVPIKT